MKIECITLLDDKNANFHPKALESCYLEFVLIR